MHYILPGRGRFLSKKPETFEHIPLGCHNYVSSQSRQCFLWKNFLSSSAASLIHQNSPYELIVTKRVYFRCKSRSPKIPRPLSVRNELKFRIVSHLHQCCSLFISNAPINVMPAWRGGGGVAGHGVGMWLFWKICNQIPCPRANHSSQMQSNFPTPGLHIAFKYPKADPKKDTVKIFPNKTLQSLFIIVAASPKIHACSWPFAAAIIRFNHNPCYTA